MGLDAVIASAKNLGARLYMKWSPQGDGGPFETIVVSKYVPVGSVVNGDVSKGDPKGSFTTGARVLPISAWRDRHLVDNTLAQQQLCYLEVMAGPATFLPGPLDEVVKSDGTWKVIGCTPTDKDGVGITFGVGCYKL